MKFSKANYPLLGMLRPEKNSLWQLLNERRIELDSSLKLFRADVLAGQQHALDLKQEMMQSAPPFFYIPDRTETLIAQKDEWIQQKCWKLLPDLEFRGVLLLEWVTDSNCFANFAEHVIVSIQNGKAVVIYVSNKYVVEMATAKVVKIGSGRVNTELEFVYTVGDKKEDDDFYKDALDYSLCRVLFLLLYETEKFTLNINRTPRITRNDVEYYNAEPVDVHIVDSAWFTTIIRTDPFGVSGHFRLQPCGEGLTMKRLIWIKAFTKNGYKRKAKHQAIEAFDEQLCQEVQEETQAPEQP